MYRFYSHILSVPCSSWRNCSSRLFVACVRTNSVSNACIQPTITCSGSRKSQFLQFINSIQKFWCFFSVCQKKGHQGQPHTALSLPSNKIMPLPSRSISRIKLVTSAANIGGENRQIKIGVWRLGHGPAVKSAPIRSISAVTSDSSKPPTRPLLAAVRPTKPRARSTHAPIQIAKHALNRVQLVSNKPTKTMVNTGIKDVLVVDYGLKRLAEPYCLARSFCKRMKFKQLTAIQTTPSHMNKHAQNTYLSLLASCHGCHSFAFVVQLALLRFLHLALASLACVHLHQKHAPRHHIRAQPVAQRRTARRRDSSSRRCSASCSLSVRNNRRSAARRWHWRCNAYVRVETLVVRAAVRRRGSAQIRDGAGPAFRVAHCRERQ